MELHRRRRCNPRGSEISAERTAGDVGPHVIELRPWPVLLIRVTGERPAGLRLIVKAEDGKDPVAFDWRLANTLVAISVRVHGKFHLFEIDGRVEETTIRLPAEGR